MAVFPLQFLTGSGVPVAFNERYASSPLGLKFAGQPKGVYIGFVPSTLGPLLTLSPDPVKGYSLVKVPSQEDPSGMDLILTTPVVLDFTGQPALDFPIHVIATSSYYDNSTQSTTAAITTRSASVGPVLDDETLICTVLGPAASITAFNDPSIGEQDAPLAYSGVDFGFMPGGSVESLQAAADIVAEILAARTGLDSTTHASLSARLAEDYGASSMAGRLALVFRALRSNDYEMLSGESITTVSGSFSEIDRDFLPEVTLDGNGDESTAGAVASPSDAIRNVALIVDATTGYRLIDNDTDRRVIFGRISGPNEDTVSGEWLFSNASQSLIATDSNGQATVELAVRDSVLGPDGNHYEVSAITDNNNLVLRTAYQGTSATSTAVIRRRWQLLLKKLVSGVEQTAVIPANTTIRFFLPAFLSIAQSNADWKMAMHTAAERPPLQAATTTVPGVVRLADIGSRLGSIKVQNAGVPLAGGPFHTFNFNAANASVLPTVTPGEVDVAQIGPQGAQGPDGSSGGPGLPGGPGPGFSQLNPYEASSEFITPGVHPATPFSFTADMGHNIRVLHGNIARYRDEMAFVAGPGGDRLEVTGVSQISATEGRIEGTYAGNTAVIAFLSSAGD